RRSAAGDQVRLYESSCGDANGAVPGGLLTAVGYLKDSRLLPRGFEKQAAEPDIAVHGEAAADPDFAGATDRVGYAVALGAGQGPFTVDAELLYQPIGYRWATNLKAYTRAAEPQRFTTYYDAMAGSTATALARSTRSIPSRGKFSFLVSLRSLRAPRLSRVPAGHRDQADDVERGEHDEPGDCCPRGDECRRY